MKDNSDIPLPLDQLRSRVLVFAITDEATHEYEEITKGYVQLSTDEDGKNHTFHYLQVKDQQTHQVLMRSNLKIQNNFGKQKGSIISWTDNQQPQYQQIALSFQKDRQCDMFWRTICQKIGKSYLQINGMEKLQPPTVNNLNFILQKAKNSIDLMDYNIVHSGVMLEGLRGLFGEMKRNGDEFGMGIIYRIIHAIMSPSYSSIAIQTLLTKQNFFLILDLQQFRKSIPFRSIYQQKVAQYLSNKFSLPPQIYQKIQISHRAIFYRQNVLELSEDGMLESLMLMVGKEAQVEIVSYLNRSRFLDTVVAWDDGMGKQMEQQMKKQMDCQQQRNENNTNQQEANNNHNNTNNSNSNNPQLTRSKLQFLYQAIVMHNQISGQHLKQTFKQNLYSSKVLPFIKSQIDFLNPKSLEILYAISQMDKLKFFQYLIDNFKLNSSDNLMKSLMKVYLNSLEMRGSVAGLIEELVPLFNLKKELLDFFIGTFVCSVFAVAKDLRPVLILSNILLSLLQNSSILFPQLIKLSICHKLSNQYRTGTTLHSKLYQLQLIKFLKYILIQQSHKGASKHKQIQKTLLSSGLLQCCMMIYMKHSTRYNVISSSMLENLKILQKMDSSEIHGFIVKEYVDSQNCKGNQILMKMLQPIKTNYYDYLSKKMHPQNDSQQDYLELQRMVHQEILQNQHQETYLMNEDYQEPIGENNNKTLNKPQQQINQNPPNSHQNHPTPNNNSLTQHPYPRKQDSLLFLKRMMDQIKQDQQDINQRQPRKIVKRSQDSKQTAIQFCFDLPDMDEIVPEQQMQGT